MTEKNPVAELYLEAVNLTDDTESQMSVINDWYFAIASTIMRHYGEGKVPTEWEFEPSDYDRANITTVDGDIEPRIQTAPLETLIEAGENVIEDGLLLREEMGEG